MSTGTTYRCEGCYIETDRLFDGDSCALCHFAYLTHCEAEAQAHCELLGRIIVMAFEDANVRPDDLKDVLESALKYIDGCESGGRRSLREISAERRALSALVRPEGAV